MYPAKTQIQAWQDEAKCRYPDFDLVLQLRFKKGVEEYCLYFQPLPETCTEQIEPLFPLGPVWYPMEWLWRESGETEVDFIFSLYPDRASLAKACNSGLRPKSWSRLASRVGEILFFYCCCILGLVAVIGLIAGLAVVGSWIGLPRLWMVAAPFIMIAAFYGPFHLAAIILSKKKLRTNL